MRFRLIGRLDKDHALWPGGFSVFQPAGPLRAPAPIDYVVNHLVARRSVTFLVGYGSSMKSWAALDVARCVATGEPWLHRFSCTRGRVAYLDWETNIPHLHRRVEPLLRGAGADGWPSRLGLVSRPDFPLNHADAERRLTRLGGHVSLIVIDSFRASIPGVDENESSARQYIDMCSAVAAKTDTAFLLVHHAKKSGGHATTDKRELLRGSSALFDAADAVLHLAVEAKRRCIRVQQVKGREGEVSPFEFALLPAPGGLHLVGYDAGKAPANLEAEEARVRAVLDFLATNQGASQADVCRAVPGKRVTKSSLLDAMAGRGLIVNEGSAQRQRWFLASGDGRSIRGSTRLPLGTAVVPPRHHDGPGSDDPQANGPASPGGSDDSR
jgi:hypothetical protein